MRARKTPFLRDSFGNLNRLRIRTLEDDFSFRTRSVKSGKWEKVVFSRKCKQRICQQADTYVF